MCHSLKQKLKNVQKKTTEAGKDFYANYVLNIANLPARNGGGRSQTEVLHNNQVVKYSAFQSRARTRRGRLMFASADLATQPNLSLTICVCT